MTKHLCFHCEKEWDCGYKCNTAYDEDGIFCSSKCREDFEKEAELTL